jgi:uncharacterized protein YdeI (YjbR/CyaY-like superfamily)
MEHHSKDEKLNGISLLYCRDATQWRRWLQRHHEKETGIWLVYLKGQGIEQLLTYEESLDEALCFGWIDSLIRRIDETRYVRKFTPRKPVSKWSETNKKRIMELSKQGRMAEAGGVIVAKAMQNGSWDKPDRPLKPVRVPSILQKALAANKKAKAYFDSLPPSHKARYVAWIANAKKQETIERRTKECIRMLQNKLKLGLK